MDGHECGPTEQSGLLWGTSSLSEFFRRRCPFPAEKSSEIPVAAEQKGALIVAFARAMIKFFLYDRPFSSLQVINEASPPAIFVSSDLTAVFHSTYSNVSSLKRY